MNLETSRVFDPICDDQVPEFDYDSVSGLAEIGENSPANTAIATLRAFDRDVGENARVEYLLEDSQGGLFSVGRIDGVLRLSR